MTEEHAGAWTRTSRIIGARPEELYEAFVDPAALVAWLPPARDDGRLGSTRGSGADIGCRCSTRRTSASFRGKTSEREDMVDVRFVELAPPRRIVEAVSFVTPIPAFFGEMTIDGDVRRGVRRNRSHPACSRTCRPACGRRTTRPARDVAGTAGPPLRMTTRFDTVAVVKVLVVHVRST